MHVTFPSSDIKKLERLHVMLLWKVQGTKLTLTMKLIIHNLQTFRSSNFCAGIYYYYYYYYYYYDYYYYLFVYLFFVMVFGRCLYL